ncbi:hypothetical protein [Tenacibaculum jejuense]|nr:hypothetical protein [Tenacibaculum jejuense]
MDRIIVDIQRKFPKSTLGFQNIRIEGEDLKTSFDPESASIDYYYESKYLKIIDNKFQFDTDNTWMLYSIPLLIILVGLHSAPITDLKKIIYSNYFWFYCVVLGILCFTISYDRDDYKNQYLPKNKFESQVLLLMEELNNRNYKK